MSIDRYGTSIERQGEEIVIRMNSETGEWLLDALISHGEHIAAGARIEPLPPDANQRLGSLMRQLVPALRNNV